MFVHHISFEQKSYLKKIKYRHNNNNKVIKIRRNGQVKWKIGGTFQEMISVYQAMNEIIQNLLTDCKM